MTKTRQRWILSLLLAAMTLLGTSCESDRPDVPAQGKPKVDNVKITGAYAKDSDGTWRISKGDTISFELIAKNIEENNCQWFVDGKKQAETGKTFSFTPKEDGLYTIEVTVVNAAGETLNYTVGKVKVAPPAPVIAEFTRDGRDITNAKEPVDIGSSSQPERIAEIIDYKVKVTNVPVDKYIWIVNGDTVQDNNKPDLQLADGITGHIKVAVRNKAGVETSKSIDVQGEFRDGYFIYGMTHDGFAFYNPEREMYYRGGNHSLFTSVGGSKFRLPHAGGVNDVFIFHNRLYTLQPNNEGPGSAVITVADAQSLLVYRTYKFIPGFSFQKIGNAYNLIAVTKDKVYVSYSDYRNHDRGAVGIVNLADNSFRPVIPGTEGAYGVSGPLHTRMVRNGDDVLVPCGNKLQVIDVKTDKVVKSVVFDKDRQVLSVLKNADDCFYLLVDGKLDKSQPMWGYTGNPTTAASIVKVDAKTYAKLDETRITIDGKIIDVQGGLYSFAAISPRGSKIPEIFFLERNFSKTKLYAFNLADKETRLMIPDALENIQGHVGISGNPGTDKNRTVMVAVTDYKTSKIRPYTAQGGSYKEAIGDCDGDCSVVHTDYFAF